MLPDSSMIQDYTHIQHSLDEQRAAGVRVEGARGDGVPPGDDSQRSRVFEGVCQEAHGVKDAPERLEELVDIMGNRSGW